MRTLCDVCESAAAILFCAADEAALCRACDEKLHLIGIPIETLITNMVWKVHMCNKLASRHVRVGLAAPSDVPSCDICENAPAFFYCEIDGSSLCLQCDMIVHVGGKRTHGRYLLLRQRVEFPGDKVGLDESRPQKEQILSFEHPSTENKHNHRFSSVRTSDNNTDAVGKMGDNLIDLNARPEWMHGQASNNEGMDILLGVNYESTGIVPVGYFKRESEK